MLRIMKFISDSFDDAIRCLTDVFLEMALVLSKSFKFAAILITFPIWILPYRVWRKIRRSKIMNNDRRKLLAEAQDLISQAKDLIEQARDEEQECFDNMPEGLQQSDRGQQMEENVGALESAMDSLEQVSDELGDL